MMTGRHSHTYSRTAEDYVHDPEHTPRHRRMTSREAFRRIARLVNTSVARAVAAVNDALRPAQAVRLTNYPLVPMSAFRVPGAHRAIPEYGTPTVRHFEVAGGAHRATY